MLFLIPFSFFLYKMILKPFFKFLRWKFANVESLGEENKNKIKKQLQVEVRSEDDQQVNLRINLIKSLKEELEPEFNELKEAQAKYTLSTAELTLQISNDCCHKKEIMKVLSELSTLKEQIQISLNDQKNELAALREEIKNSFEEQLKRIEAAIRPVPTTIITPMPSTTLTGGPQY